MEHTTIKWPTLAEPNLTFLFQVKNKAPAPVQITAEQLLREAKERQLELVPAVSRYHVYYYFFVYFSFKFVHT